MTARFLLVAPVEARPNGWGPLHGSRTGACAWRLLGSNNRDLGRSITVFEDRDACEEDVLRAAAQAAEAAHAIAHDLRTGTWTWRLEGEDGPLARAARGYARQRECRYGLAVFREQATTAQLLVRSR